jgi:hypothetical protein
VGGPIASASAGSAADMPASVKLAAGEPAQSSAYRLLFPVVAFARSAWSCPARNQCRRSRAGRAAHLAIRKSLDDQGNARVEGFRVERAQPWLVEVVHEVDCAHVSTPRTHDRGCSSRFSDGPPDDSVAEHERCSMSIDATCTWHTYLTSG